MTFVKPRSTSEMNDNSYQYRYWNTLKELRTHVMYLHDYATHSEWWDKATNIFLALASSSSIAAWAIWKDQQIVWACIIALAQIISAIKPFLPYKQRLGVISELNDKIQEIALECEKKWFDVAEGELTEREIHDLQIELRNKAFNAEKRILKGVILPRKNKILKSAETKADLFLRNNYHFG
ncbi:hypothetical protein [Methylotuvimicrobium alcaliphilum]|nr:hypothetical protein [Methylotuvimicrobium alcaliphilum]